jgi:hypothetical protein
MTDVRDRMPKYIGSPDLEDLINVCRDIEKQIQQNLNIFVAEINNESMELNKEILHKLRV